VVDRRDRHHQAFELKVGYVHGFLLLIRINA
jgi:hypothetical protein